MRASVVVTFLTEKDYCVSRFTSQLFMLASQVSVSGMTAVKLYRMKSDKCAGEVFPLPVKDRSLAPRKAPREADM